jgi:hypothetical protein
MLRLRIIAGLLILSEPLRFAAEALMVLQTIGYRGTLAALELTIHGGVAAVCAAAGFALWNGSPDSKRLAAIAIVVAFLRVIQSLYWSVLPNNTVPGDEPLIAAAALIAGLGGLFMLRGNAVRRV